MERFGVVRITLQNTAHMEKEEVDKMCEDLKEYIRSWQYRGSTLKITKMQVDASVWPKKEEEEKI